MELTEREALQMALEFTYRTMGLAILTAEAAVTDETAQGYVQAQREWYWKVQDEMELAEQVDELRLGEERHEQ